MSSGRIAVFHTDSYLKPMALRICFSSTVLARSSTAACTAARVLHAGSALLAVLLLRYFTLY